MTAQTTTPWPAMAYGAAGLLPFAALAAALPQLSGDARALAAHALVAYGAAILSFLGGVHWGLAIADERGAANGSLPGQLGVSVVPSLVGWAALLFPERAGLVTLGVAILAMLAADLRATRRGQAPAWYPKLRVPLSCAVAVALFAAALS